MSLDANIATLAGAEPPADVSPRISLMDCIRIAVASPAFWPGMILFVGITCIFWPLFRVLPALWFDKDGYYTQGAIIGPMAAYMVYRWWPKISKVPAKPGYLSLVLFLPMLWAIRQSIIVDIPQLQSVLFVTSLLLAAWFIAGFRWAFMLSPAILYLIFGLPVWTSVIDQYTNKLQLMSTEMAFSLLNIYGLHPLKSNITIYLDHFTLDVAVPCSGLKLILAITAFTIFFLFISRLKWWGNLAMLALIFPLCLFINGLRISLIGVVGNAYGEAAGLKFHDYSGYITLVVCFLILFRCARWFGWKD